MVTKVDVRINNADTIEISNLSSLLQSIGSPEFRDNIIKKDTGNDYIVTVEPGKLQALKDALRVILRIVTAERVVIET